MANSGTTVSLLTFDSNICACTVCEINPLRHQHDHCGMSHQHICQRYHRALITTIMCFFLVPVWTVGARCVCTPIHPKDIVGSPFGTVRCFLSSSDYSCMGHPSRDGIVTSLASFVPLAVPHFRKGGVDMALLKHQGMAVAAGLAVSSFVRFNLCCCKNPIAELFIEDGTFK